MKISYLMSFLCCLFLASSSYAQSDIALTHNWMSQGRDVELSIDHYFGKHVAHIGLNVFQNNAQPAHIEHYAQTDSERIGINIAYKYSIKLAHSAIELLPKVKTQVSHLRDTGGSEGARVLSAPYWQWYNTIGLDSKVQLYKQFYLTGGAEGGIAWLQPGQGFSGLENWGLSYNLFLGLSYRL